MSAWQDGRPNWDTGEVRLWIENEEWSYYASLRAVNPAELRDALEFMPGPRVDWDIVDWDWVFEHTREED